MHFTMVRKGYKDPKPQQIEPSLSAQQLMHVALTDTALIIPIGVLNNTCLKIKWSCSPIS